MEIQKCRHYRDYRNRKLPIDFIWRLQRGKKSIALISFNNVKTTEIFVAMAKGKNLSRQDWQLILRHFKYI